MGEPKLLDRQTIERAFGLMGQYLLDRKALGEIAIYGGSAILFQFDWRKASRDVDARITSDRNQGLVIDAAAGLRWPRIKCVRDRLLLPQVADSTLK